MNFDPEIAVVGCGALGSFYGAKLCQAGRRTHFLLRSDYDQVRRHGVCIRSPTGDVKVRPRCARDPGEIGPVDLVLIGLKTTANDQFPRLLPPLVGEQTLLLTLQNGLGNEEALARCFPVSRILGGLCFVCLNRIEPGVVRHIAHGNVVLGEHSGWPQPRTHDIASLFRHAGIPCKVTDRLARAHWEKLVWNIPFNGLGVASAAGLKALLGEERPQAGNRLPCRSTAELLDAQPWRQLVHELMMEVIHAARALGHEVAFSLADQMMAKTRSMGAYKPSTVLDFEQGRPLERDALFRFPLRQAEGAGVETPRLRTLCRVLDALDTHPRRAEG